MQMDTTKDNIRLYLEDAMKVSKENLQSGSTMRIAALKFILDAAEITDADKRKAVAKQFLATPGWFGCNTSACRQAYGIKSALESIEIDLDGV